MSGAFSASTASETIRSRMFPVMAFPFPATLPRTALFALPSAGGELGTVFKDGPLQEYSIRVATSG